MLHLVMNAFPAIFKLVDLEGLLSGTNAKRWLSLLVLIVIGPWFKMEILTTLGRVIHAMHGL